MKEKTKTTTPSAAKEQPAAPAKRPGLGRGLDALFSSNTNSHSSIGQQKAQQANQANAGDSQTSQATVGVQIPSANIVISVPVSSIIANKDQPRRHFDQEKLEELASSIAANGLLQPILLQAVENGKYQIVAGERRFRASQMAGLTEIHSIVIPVDSERNLLELALLENIQRTDLSIVEEARAYASLVEDFKCTHDMISRNLGKSRSHITNCLRILKMPDFVLNLIESGEISFGHAKVIAGLEDPAFWAQMVIEKGLTVRMLEKAILLEKESSKQIQTGTSTQSDRKKNPTYQDESDESESIKDSQLNNAISRFNSQFFSLGRADITEEKDGTIYIITQCKNRKAALKMLNQIASNNQEQSGGGL